MLDGQQLTPLAHRGELKPRIVDKEFHTRIEGAFNKIIRHGNSPDNYWWEVTDKNGTRFFYGGTPEQGLLPGAVLSISPGSNIFRWCLAQMRDTNDNTIDYSYAKIFDCGVGNGTGGVAGVQEATFMAE